MNLVIEKQDLLAAVSHVRGAIEARNVVPILSHVLLDADAYGRRLRVTATDLDLRISDVVAAEVRQPGARTVPGATLFEIARKLPDGKPVEIAVGDDARLSLRCGRSRFHLQTLDPVDFPAAAAADDGGVAFCMPAADLRTLIDRTRFAISTEETRYYLNGIHLHAKTVDGTPLLRAVATDGHRLALADVPLPQRAAGMPGVIVPRKAIGELRKLLNGTDGDVEVQLSDRQIRVECGNVVLSSKLIDGAFPDYERVIPASKSSGVEMQAGDLVAALERVSVVANDRSRAVCLRFDGDDMKISASSQDGGAASDEVDARSVGRGGAPVIGFNGGYLGDVLEQIGNAAVVRIEAADAEAPARIYDPEDSSALFVLMPMRVAYL